jgi:hypothetical protein
VNAANIFSISDIHQRFYKATVLLHQSVAADSKVQNAFIHSNSRIVGSTPAWGMDVCLRFLFYVWVGRGLATGSSFCPWSCTECLQDSQLHINSMREQNRGPYPSKRRKRRRKLSYGEGKQLVEREVVPSALVAECSVLTSLSTHRIQSKSERLYCLVVSFHNQYKKSRFFIGNDDIIRKW